MPSGNASYRAKLRTADEAAAMIPDGATEVHWVVSENGAACLKGKSTAERARALIELAHPRFRDELTAAAKSLRYV